MALAGLVMTNLDLFNLGAIGFVLVGALLFTAFVVALMGDG